VLLTDRPAIAELVAEGLALNGRTAAGGARAWSFEWDEVREHPRVLASTLLAYRVLVGTLLVWQAGAARCLAELGGHPDVLIACDCIFAPLCAT
jgi:hypothetical protein